MRVLLHCCGQEATYNPYYAHLAHRLASYDRTYRFSLQMALWDSLRLLQPEAGDAEVSQEELKEMTSRRAANIARLTAHAVAEGSLTLAALKASKRCLTAWLGLRRSAECVSCCLLGAFVRSLTLPACPRALSSSSTPSS